MTSISKWAKLSAQQVQAQAWSKCVLAELAGYIAQNAPHIKTLVTKTSAADEKLSPLVRELNPAIQTTFKDNYVLEFLGQPETHSESDLQKALTQHIKAFILELGNDFIFMGEEYRLQVGNQDFYIDLLFYHRGLAALVAFELKIGQLSPEHMGQFNFYLEALDRDVKKPFENPPCIENTTFYTYLA